MDSKKSVFRKPVSPLSLIVLFVSFACFAGFYGYKFYIEYQDALIDAGVFPQRGGSFWRRDPAPNNLVTTPAQITLHAPSIPNFPPSLYDGPSPNILPPTVETPDCLVSDFDWVDFQLVKTQTDEEKQKLFGSNFVYSAAKGKPGGACADWIIGVDPFPGEVDSWGIKFYALHTQTQEVLFVPNLSFFREGTSWVTEISQTPELCSAVCLRYPRDFAQPFRFSGLTNNFFKDFKGKYQGRVFKTEANGLIKVWSSIGIHPDTKVDAGQTKKHLVGDFGFKEGADPSLGKFFWPNGIPENFRRIVNTDVEALNSLVLKFSEKIKAENLKAKIPLAEFTYFECTKDLDSKRDTQRRWQEFVSLELISKSKPMKEFSDFFYMPPPEEIEKKYETYKYLSGEAKKFEKENATPCKPGGSLIPQNSGGGVPFTKSAWLYNCLQDISKEDFFKAVPIVYLKVDDLYLVCENLLHSTRFNTFFAEPIIYVYSSQIQEIEIREGRPNLFSVTKPNAAQGYWRVENRSDGTLWDLLNKVKVPYLFWEGHAPAPLQTAPNFGFKVKTQHLKEFFDRILPRLGLQGQEIQDFQKFWIPELNKFNVNEWLLSFLPQSDTEKFAPLSIEPKPATLIRVFMDFQPMPENKFWQPQHFNDFQTPIRKGLTVVEWGGTRRHYEKPSGNQ